MSFNNLMNSIRQWDNLTAKWLMRHFYFTFFQIVLVIVFVVWFANIFTVIDVGTSHESKTTMERILVSQSINMGIVVFLLLLNSFWLLFMFNTIQRVLNVLKDVNYHLSRRHSPNEQSHRKD